MKSGSVEAVETSKAMVRKPPSLVDLCVEKAIDNIGHIGDVDDTDTHLLERFLPHCNAQQLMHVENKTNGRDLSQVTDKLWFQFYEKKFETQNANGVLETMKKNKRRFYWRQLYQAKLKEQDDLRKHSVERLAQAYKKEQERRQSGRIQICDKVPTSRTKRPFHQDGVGSNIRNVKSKMMKRVLKEHTSSIEHMNYTTMTLTRKGIQKTRR